MKLIKLQDSRLLTVRATVRSGEGNGTPLQDSCLENPMDGGAWGATVHGVTKSWTRLSDLTFTVRRKWPGNRLGQAGQSVSCQRAPLGGGGRERRALETAGKLGPTGTHPRLGSVLYLAS